MKALLSILAPILNALPLGEIVDKVLDKTEAPTLPWWAYWIITLLTYGLMFFIVYLVAKGTLEVKEARQLINTIN